MFRGLAHPIRRQVLALLKQKDRTVGEIHEQLDGPIAMPTLSRHLLVLRDAGLVKQQKQGHHRVYRINRSGAQRASKWLSQMI